MNKRELERKQQIIKDADLLLMYGSRDTSFEPYAIVRLCMDEDRFERAVRMIYRRDTNIELNHYDKIIEELDLNMDVGHINYESYLFTKMKIDELLYRATPDISKQVKIRHLKTKLNYYEIQEDYETCINIKNKLDILKNRTAGDKNKISENRTHDYLDEPIISNKYE